ncbi:MAG: hypothetical protein HGA37_04685 [Lentimicrobium sp.]|nr:hypothetical protein [Lentimicrobium sp.]
MKRRNIVTDYILIALFSLVLISAFFQQWIKVLPEVQSHENRALSPMPEFNPGFLDPFPRSFEAYYNDHFVFRNQFIKFYADLTFNVFHKCPYPDQVIIGSANHLFMVPKELEAYQRTNLFTNQELDKIRSEFKYRKAYFETKGIDYYVAVCPTKYSVYPEYLPWFVQARDTISRTDQFLKVLTGIGIEVVDLRIVLNSAKDSVQENLFMLTDNHWNEIGAFLGYQNIMSRIVKKYPQLKYPGFEDYTIRPYHRNGGNLANILNLQNELSDIQYTFNLNRPVKTNITTHHQYELPDDFDSKEFYVAYSLVDNTRKLPRLMLIHDSFGKFIRPFFKDSFSQSVFVWDKWQYKINEPIVEKEKPDIYISITLESLLPGLVKNCEIRN